MGKLFARLLFTGFIAMTVPFWLSKRLTSFNLEASSKGNAIVSMVAFSPWRKQTLSLLVDETLVANLAIDNRW